MTSLDLRSLNRALLARQLLLERTTLSVPEALEHLVGLQAQATPPPYFALFARLAAFAHEDLSRVIRDRSAVRIALMRSTIHLVTAGDCLALRPLMAPAIERGLYTGSPFGKRLGSISIAAIAATARELLVEQPRTHAELGKLIAARLGGDAEALGAAARTFVPLVQIPPRGIFGEGGQPVCVAAESWLARPLESTPSRESLVRRYLAAFGPASARDAATWSGLTDLSEVFEALRATLVVFHDERGRELFDLPDAPRPSAKTPAPPRLLPEFDNALLAHADRTHIVAPEIRARFANTALRGSAPVLLDGFVAGAWKIERDKKSAVLRIELFGNRPTKKAQGALIAEAGRVLAFAEPGLTKGARVVELIG